MTKPFLSAPLKKSVLRRFRLVVKKLHPAYRRKDVEREADAMYLKLLDELADKPDTVTELEAAVRGFETAKPQVATVKPDIKLVRADQLPRLIDALARDGVQIPGREPLIRVASR